MYWPKECKKWAVVSILPSSLFMEVGNQPYWWSFIRVQGLIWPDKVNSPPCWSAKAFEQEKHCSCLKALRFGSYLLWKESLFLSDWFNYKFSLSYNYIDLYWWSSIIFNQNGCWMIFECYINVYMNAHMYCTCLYHVYMHVYFYVWGCYENIKVMLRGEKVIWKEVENWVMEYMWQDTEEGRAGESWVEMNDNTMWRHTHIDFSWLNPLLNKKRNFI